MEVATAINDDDCISDITFEVPRMSKGRSFSDGFADTKTLLPRRYRERLMSDGGAYLKGLQSHFRILSVGNIGVYLQYVI